MEDILLIISAIAFISTFGIHASISKSTDEWDRPPYLDNQLLTTIPWVSGFVLPIIPFSIVFETNWIAIFFINLAIVYIIGPNLTKIFLRWFAGGKGLGKDMMTAFIVGWVTLIIGLLINNN